MNGETNQNQPPDLIITKDQQRSIIIWKANKPISKEDAVKAQESKGYPVAGYGFFGYKVTNQKTTWTSYSAC